MGKIQARRKEMLEFIGLVIKTVKVASTKLYHKATRTLINKIPVKKK
jgi:hypothetical protein